MDHGWVMNITTGCIKHFVADFVDVYFFPQNHLHYMILASFTNVNIASAHNTKHTSVASYKKINHLSDIFKGK